MQPLDLNELDECFDGRRNALGVERRLVERPPRQSKDVLPFIDDTLDRRHRPRANRRRGPLLDSAREVVMMPPLYVASHAQLVELLLCVPSDDPMNLEPRCAMSSRPYRHERLFSHGLHEIE